MQQAGAPYASTPKAQRHYANSPSAMVTKWHTPILCIHGMMDYRIPYEQGMAAFNAAQMMGVPSKLLVFPEENHWILQPQNALFWHRNFYDWLDQWLKK
jgi:dipeptidyl aminopeptidase/acylaminoacyl peptidase